MKGTVTTVLTLLLLGGCASTPKVDSLYDKDADFSLYKTYAFSPTQSENTSKYSSLVDKFLKAAVSDELTARGYTKSDNPDLLVNFHISTEEKTDIYSMQHSTPSYYDYRYRYGYAPWPYYTTDTRINQYTEGTLNIDIVDARQKQLVWEGIAIGRVRDRSMENLQQRVGAVVKLIFEKYPFRAGAATPVILQKE